MQVYHISKNDLEKICQNEESHFFDFKTSSDNPSSVEKAAVAFANADGGEIYVGIADKKVAENPEERLQPFVDLESMNSFLQVLYNVEPPLDIQYEVLKYEDAGYVLHVILEKTQSVHQTSQKKVVQRRGAQSLSISDPEKITQLSFHKGAKSFEDYDLNDVSPDEIVDSDELSRFLQSVSPSVDSLEFLVKRHFLNYKTWAPRVAAAALFHNFPVSVISRKCSVKITRYETREDDPERTHLQHYETIEGPCYYLIQQSVYRVRQIMSSVEVWTKDGLRHLDFPPEAIWEIVANAVIHRDYSISDDTQILIFDNRIEIVSPGKLPGYVTIDNILDARFSRNSKIVGVLARYQNAPNKDLGEGLNTAFQKMKEWGLQKPEVREDGNYVKVTLPHSPLAAPATAILDFLYTNDSITNKQARDITGIGSENRVKREFNSLRDEGYIQRVPGLYGAKAAWQITDEGIKKKKSADDSDE